MPKGIGMDWKGYPSRGIHLSTGDEFPDSPCGAGRPSVSDIEDVTCPAVSRSLSMKGRRLRVVLIHSKTRIDSRVQEFTPVLHPFRPDFPKSL